MAVLGVILVLLALMTIHEGGHFLLCVSLGIPVKSLHLGIPVGPQLKLRLGKYPFTISPLLFGAAVQIDDQVLWKAPLWKRYLVFLAGPGANFFSVAVAGAIMTGSLSGFIGGFAMVGVTAALMIRLAGALLDGTIPFAEVAGQTVGPVGIVALGSELVSSGAVGIFSLFTLLSVWIGMFNLLPIPGLDGGQIATETLVSLGLPRPASQILTIIFLGLLFGLFILVTVRDVVNLF